MPPRDIGYVIRAMRVWVLIVLLGIAPPVWAQLPRGGPLGGPIEGGAQPVQPVPQAGMPAQTYAFFQCFCTTTAGAPLPNQFAFVPQAPRQWNGSVYAASDRDAAVKARNACTSERRGNLFDCINCRCGR